MKILSTKCHPQPLKPSTAFVSHFSPDMKRSAVDGRGQRENGGREGGTHRHPSGPWDSSAAPLTEGPCDLSLILKILIPPSLVAELIRLKRLPSAIETQIKLLINVSPWILNLATTTKKWASEQANSRWRTRPSPQGRRWKVDSFLSVLLLEKTASFQLGTSVSIRIH